MQITKDAITIPKRAVERQGGFVILTLREYQELRERAIPTYQLHGKEAEELDKLVEEGLRDYEEGRTISAPSLREALNKYERGNKKNKKR
ncbi:MAG: hypothetical protein HY001_05435 [Candidatus Portnoybacteria bacterium]|nr:hypothetical protein [Candidatus Portnoybacteria bacterium]